MDDKEKEQKNLVSGGQFVFDDDEPPAPLPPVPKQEESNSEKPKYKLIGGSFHFEEEEKKKEPPPLEPEERKVANTVIPLIIQMFRTYLVLIVIALIICAIPVYFWFSTCPPYFPFPSKIICTCPQGNKEELFLLEPDGSKMERLTYSAKENTKNIYPRWSRDGEKITYTSDQGGNTDIYIMDVKTKETKNLTNHPSQDRESTWSYDGKKIAFSSNRDGDYEIFIMNNDGTGLYQLTYNSKKEIEIDPDFAYLLPEQRNDLWDDTHPVWSPKKNQIVYSSSCLGLPDNYYEQFTEGHTQITTPMGNLKIPVPTKKGTDMDLMIINTDRTGYHDLTKTPDIETEPSWSPDGKKIAFSSNRRGNWQIFVMNSDGTGLYQLTMRDTANDRYPTWSPDGKWIAFQSTREVVKQPDAQIYIVRAEGMKNPNEWICQLTKDKGSKLYPCWSGFLSTD